MDNTRLRRPQVYLNLEFGLSLSPQHLPNSHHITYQSRGLRQRLATEPQQPPAIPTHARPLPSVVHGEVARPSYDNYYYYQYQHNWDGQRRDRRFEPCDALEHERWHRYQQQRQWRQQQQAAAQTEAPIQAYPPSHAVHAVHTVHAAHHHHRQHRPVLPPVPGSRSSRSSERGHSAPPDGRGGVAAAAAAAQTWKPLPETPGRFRLGEGDLPWSFGPDVDPDDERLRPGSASSSAAASWSAPRTAVSDDDTSILHALRTPAPAASRRPVSVSFSNNPTVLPLEAVRSSSGGNSSSSSSNKRSPAAADPQRRRELEALSAALATVDNGFEGQWWNRGDKAPLPLVAATSSWPTARSVSASAPAPAGWASSRTDGPLDWPATDLHTPPMTPGPMRRITRSTSDYVVSAVTPSSAHTDAAAAIGRSPGVSLRQQAVSPLTVDEEDLPFAEGHLHRTLSTRSEELFLTGSRYA